MAEKFDKKGWASRFKLVGKVVVTDFALNQESASGYIYSRMNLGIDCGSGYGTNYVRAFGGYSPNRKNEIRVHGKTENGKDDFSTVFNVAWEDRLDDDAISAVADADVYTVSVENLQNGSPYRKKFLSQYDAIEYMKEHLSAGMEVIVTGTLTYREYNGNIICDKVFRSIRLNTSGEQNVASFTQSVLLTKDSIDRSSIKDGFCKINAFVLEYAKEYKGHEVKQTVAMPYTFEYDLRNINMSAEDAKEQIKKRLSLFTVKRGVTEIKFNGEFIEVGSASTITENDLSDDIRELIAMGIASLEDYTNSYAASGDVVRKAVLKLPCGKVVERSDGTKSTVLDKVEQQYEEKDLAIHFNDDELDDDDWLNSIG